MPKPFVHLHNHTEYSLLDGATRIPGMVSRAKELEMPSIAITDHGVMFGVMEFYTACKKAGIKPIVGVEAYVAPGGIQNKGAGEEKDSFHLLLLAKNNTGYKNLCKLSTIAALDGYYRRPRVDHDILRAHSEGLVATSACLGSEVCQELLRGRYDRAQYLAGMYDEMFGHGNFFVELQDHGLPEQKEIKGSLIRIAKELDIPLIATNDSHYLCRGDATMHDILLCIQTGSLVSEGDRFKFDGEEFFIKSQEEMERIFSDVPEALENTLRVADMCDVSLERDRPETPDPVLPEGETSKTFLRKLAWEGLQRRIRNVDESATARLEHELSVIESMGFESYFLLVREFTQFSKSENIFTGVRGSAAGSLVSYCLGITEVDPLEYDLTFERFLNPERISMPDIDLDFEDARRHEVIEWVTNRCGPDHVAQIVTYSTLGAKAAIKDCGRVLGYSPVETDKITKTIPSVPHISIKHALEASAEFHQLYESDERVKSLVDQARRVEGTVRGSGVHAAGIVITKDPTVEYIPLYRGKDGQPVTAYEMGVLEQMQLLKMDFLGLSNLTVLSKCIANIKKTHGIDLDVLQIPLDDQKTYDMLSKGDTVGVFQLESGGMRRNIIELKPQSVRELAAMVALYRPGPMEHIPKYIDSKHGRRKPEYLHERMEPILRETYGVIVYQDQVLKLVQALAGFSLGKSDILRRAMGKKKKKDLDAMKTEFLAGTAANGISAEVAEQIWVMLEPFSGYAFNKAHAVCYAMVAYQTAYLKANYPVEYLAALMATYAGTEAKVVNFIEEARRQNVAVLPPDVNESDLDFSAQGKRIRFGLGAIKNVGTGLMESVIADRVENGPYTHFYEFCERTKPFGMNRTAVEALVKAGAFDGLTRARSRLLAAVEDAMAFAEAAARNKAAGQESLFGEPSTSNDAAPAFPPLPEAEAWSRSETLTGEKEVLGIYVSDHPLRGLERHLQTKAGNQCAAVAEMDEGESVKLAGILTQVRIIVTRKKGEKMAALVLEDFSGQAAVTVFPATYAKFSPVIAKDALVVLSGKVVHRERMGNGGEKNIEIRMEDIESLEPALNLVSNVVGGSQVTISVARATEKQVRGLREVLKRHPGEHDVVLQLLPLDSYIPMPLPFSVEPSQAFVAAVRKAVPGATVEVGMADGFLEDVDAEASLVESA